VGLPGSGKSTWIRDNKFHALSSDHVRHLLSDDEDNQKIHRLVFGTLRYLVRRRIEAGMPVTYVDATSIAAWERRSWIKLAGLLGCEIEAVFFDTPLDLCLERNASRKRVVPPEVIRSMSNRMVRPTTEEGFSRVTVVPATVAAPLAKAKPE